METAEMQKLPQSGADGPNATEVEPCLPQGGNSVRKSMECLNKNRENDDQNTSVLEAEKNKRNDCRSSYRIKPNSKSSNRFKRPFNFNSPPSKFEQWCSDRTGLSRIGLIVQGLILLLLFVLTIVIIIMACLWPTLPHSLVFPVCRTSACLIASSEVLTKMNQSAHPCDDIREYACGHWQTTHSIPPDKSEWGVKQHMQYKHREKLRDMITTMPHPEDLEKIQWKVKNIYDSCMSLGTIETEGAAPLRKVISQLGGWRVLRDFSLPNWDMKKTLRQLHSKYNIQPFFRIDVVPDAKQAQQNIIQISPGNLGLPDKSYYFRLQRSDDKVVTAYKRYLKDVAMIFGATSDDASTFSEDLFGFERRLAERFPSRIPDRPGQYRPTIAKLEDIAPSVPLFDILSAMFPDAKLTKKSEVIVIASDHLVNVSRIISTTDKTALNDYMMWRLATEYLPYLSKKYRNTANEFNRHLFGYEEPKARWEVCIETLQKFFGFGLEALLEVSHPDHDRKRKVVNELFDQIVGATKDAISSSHNLPVHIQDHFLDKMNTIGLQVGLPLSMRQPSYYNDYYKSLISMKDDYFRNVLFGVSFLLEEQQRRLILSLDEHRWIDIVSDGSLKIIYVPEVNKVIVPLSLLAMPYFHTHYPLSVLYGSIGTELGLAILSSVTGRGLFHAGDGVLLDSDHPVCNITHDCFLHHPLTTPYLEAIKYTYKALGNALEHLPHAHQPALENLEDQAIFFVSHAQSLCTMKTTEKLDIDITLHVHPNDVSILHLLSSKSKEFSTTFSCMHSLRKDTCDSLI